MTETERRLINRAYFFGPDNHIVRPPKLIEALDDDQAIEAARRMVDGHALEVWDQQRLVTRLEPRMGPTTDLIASPPAKARHGPD